jgi:hypothetical protein
MAHGGPGSVPSAARRSLVRLCGPRSPKHFGNTAFLIVLPHNSFCRRSRTQGVGGLRCRNCRVFGNEGYPWSKLGSIVFQFPFFNRSIFPDRRAFTDRLVPFLKKRPADHKFGIEIRNRDWLDAEFADLLRDHQIALVLQDRSWMPNPLELQFDPITAGWTYIRWARS